jgi:phenylacetate-CoA ligase
MVGPHEPRPGGVTTQVETLSRCLRGEGVQVRSVDTNIPALRRQSDLGRWLLPLGQSLLVPWRLWRAAGDADLIHVHLASHWGFFLPMSAIAWARLWRRIPVVATYHGGGAEKFVARRGRLVRRLLPLLDALTSPAYAVGKVFEPLGLTPSIIPNLVGWARFAPRPAGGTPVANQPAPQLLWIKRFDSTGNPELMVRAFALVRQQIPAAQLTMIGEGPKLPAMRALTAQLDLPVLFIARVPFEALEPVYAAADLFVSSSAVDIQPNTLIEAASIGLPIVATSVGGVPEMLHDNVDALLASPDNPAALAAAIVRVLREPGLAERLGQAAQINAQRFTWPAVRPQWAAVYGEVIGRSDER